MASKEPSPQHIPTPAEFHKVIAERSDRWYSACLRITKDPDLAADAVQDALLNAWRKRHQFDHNAQLDTWIHRIAINAALQLLRKRKPDRWGPMPPDPADETSLPETEQTTRELERSLGTAMHELSEMEQVCFVLKHLEQWRLAEIADQLNVNVGTIKQALFRGVKKLRVGMADLRSTA
ncbi:MAG: sigma-70 family RNA polymerase sigma factor [Pseudomonadota bacterium]